MKIRQGLVSNSSSSSFVVMHREGVTEKDVQVSLVSGPNSPFYHLAKRVAHVLMSPENCKTEEQLANVCTYGYLDEWEEYKEDEDLQLALYKMKDGWIVRYGRASNEDDLPGGVLCEMDIDYESPDLIIKKNGGYE